MAINTAYEVVLGPKSLLSLVGVFSIIVGHWWVEAEWDEQGSEAYIRAVNQMGKVDMIGDFIMTKLSELSEEDRAAAVKISAEELEAAYHRPWMSTLGWILLATTFFFSNESGYTLTWSIPAIIGALACLFIASEWFLFVRSGIMRRDHSSLRWSMMTVSIAIVILAVALVFLNRDVPFWVCPVGVIFLGLSFLITWRRRKMGHFWVANGRPNPKSATVHMGGPLLVIGFYILWLGSEAVVAGQAETSLPILPIDFNDRTIVAHIAILFAIFITYVVDNAHDNGPGFDDSEIPQAAFGLSDTYFGRTTEIWIPFTLCGILFGTSSFLQSFHPYFDSIIMIICISIGRAVGLLYTRAIRKPDLERWRRWANIISALLVILSILVSIGSWFALWLSMFGTFFVIFGFNLTLADRRRGLSWMETRDTEDNLNSFSYGYLIYTTGLICWALAMAIPL